MINFIRSVINRIIRKDPIKPLGRWNLESCNTKINKKIDLSNEDHCGPCGQYIVEKKKDVEIRKVDSVNKNEKKLI